MGSIHGGDEGFGRGKTILRKIVLGMGMRICIRVLGIEIQSFWYGGDDGFGYGDAPFEYRSTEDYVMKMMVLGATRAL